MFPSWRWNDQYHRLCQFKAAKLWLALSSVCFTPYMIQLKMIVKRSVSNSFNSGQTPKLSTVWPGLKLVTHCYVLAISRRRVNGQFSDQSLVLWNAAVGLSSEYTSQRRRGENIMHATVCGASSFNPVGFFYRVYTNHL